MTSVQLNHARNQALEVLEKLSATKKVGDGTVLSEIRLSGPREVLFEVCQSLEGLSESGTPVAFDAKKIIAPTLTVVGSSAKVDRYLTSKWMQDNWGFTGEPVVHQSKFIGEKAIYLLSTEKFSVAALLRVLSDKYAKLKVQMLSFHYKEQWLLYTEFAGGNAQEAAFYEDVELNDLMSPLGLAVKPASMKTTGLNLDELDTQEALKRWVG